MGFRPKLIHKSRLKPTQLNVYIKRNEYSAIIFIESNYKT